MRGAVEGTPGADRAGHAATPLRPGLGLTSLGTTGMRRYFAELVGTVVLAHGGLDPAGNAPFTARVAQRAPERRRMERREATTVRPTAA